MPWWASDPSPGTGTWPPWQSAPHSGWCDAGGNTLPTAVPVNPLLKGGTGMRQDHANVSSIASTSLRLNVAKPSVDHR